MTDGQRRTHGTSGGTGLRGGVARGAGGAPRRTHSPASPRGLPSGPEYTGCPEAGSGFPATAGLGLRRGGAIIGGSARSECVRAPARSPRRGGPPGSYAPAARRPSQLRLPPHRQRPPPLHAAAHPARAPPGLVRAPGGGPPGGIQARAARGRGPQRRPGWRALRAERRASRRCPGRRDGGRGRPPLRSVLNGGESPSGKAADFGSAIRRFESFLPSHTQPGPLLQQHLHRRPPGHPMGDGR